MALLIEREIATMGINLSQIYMRFNYDVDLSGKNIIVNIANYASKDAYLNDPHNNKIKIPELKETVGLEYNREIDGDILQFIHDSYKEMLSSDKTTSTPIIDPSTGEQLIDPSTGELVSKIVVIEPKFAGDSSILVADVGDFV